MCAFIEQSWGNTLASYDHHRWERRKIERVHELFMLLITDIQDPESRIGSLFLMRSVGAFQVGAALSMATPVESYTLLRSVLELAGYGFFLSRDKAALALWSARDDSKAATAACRNALQAGKIRSATATASPGVGRTYATLYEQTITLGAHPNQHPIASSMLTGVTSEGHEQEGQMLLPGPGPELRLSMLTTARVGLCALHVFGLVFPNRFEELGMPGRMVRAGQGL